MLISCKTVPYVGVLDSEESEVTDTSEVIDDRRDSLGNVVEIRIPFEFDNPVANNVIFDADKDACRLIVSDVDFLFEVLDISQEENGKRVIKPVSEYRGDFFALFMEEGNVCRLVVFKQEKPYTPFSRRILFYTLDKEVLETFNLIIDEDATNMEY